MMPAETEETASAKPKGEQVAVDDKVLINLTHGEDDPERVLVSYLVGVESLRAGKEALMFLTQEAIYVATEGFAKTVEVPGAPSISELHDEYVERGGRFYACPVCVKTRGQQDAAWVSAAEVKGVPAVLEYTSGGSLTFSY